MTRLPVNEMVFKLKADFLKALSHPARLAIIEYLKDREAPVGRMVKDLALEQSGLSKHLAVLRQAGILRSRQERASVIYAVKNRDIYRVLRPIAVILRKRLRETEGLLGGLGKA